MAKLQLTGLLLIFLIATSNSEINQTNISKFYSGLILGVTKTDLGNCSPPSWQKPIEGSDSKINDSLNYFLTMYRISEYNLLLDLLNSIKDTECFLKSELAEIYLKGASDVYLLAKLQSQIKDKMDSLSRLKTIASKNVADKQAKLTAAQGATIKNQSAIASAQKEFDLAKDNLKTAEDAQAKVSGNQEKFQKFLQFTEYNELKILVLLVKILLVHDFRSSDIDQIIQDLKSINGSCADKFTTPLAKLNDAYKKKMEVTSDTEELNFLNLIFDVICNYSEFAEAINAAINAIQAKGDKIKSFGVAMGTFIRAIGNS